MTIVFGASVSQSGAGSTTGTGAIQVNGSLAGVGSIAPAVTNNGIVLPGASPGILSLTGGYTQTGSGKLAIDVNGATVGSGYDRLAVTGTATLAGNLQVVTAGFTPAGGDTFDVLIAGTVSGTFGSTTFAGYS